METIQIFEYEGKQIEFDLSKEIIMVNATEMAKAFDARMNDFFSNDSTKKFIESCLKNGNSRFLGIEKESDLYVSKQKSGTWMHRVLALKFAAWLDSDFELWVYLTIDKLMFGDVRSMIAQKAKIDKELREKKILLYQQNGDYQEMKLLEHKANSLKQKISGFSKTQYKMFWEEKAEENQN